MVVVDVVPEDILKELAPTGKILAQLVDSDRVQREDFVVPKTFAGEVMHTQECRQQQEGPERKDDDWDSRVPGLGFRVSGPRFRASSLGCRVS